MSAVWAETGATVWATVLGLAIAMPLAEALAQELFLARRRAWAAWAQALLSVLASTPSVVVGLLGLSWFVVAMGFGVSLVSGGLTLGLLNLPSAARSFSALLQKAPRAQVEGVLALGGNEAAALNDVLWPAQRAGRRVVVLQAAARCLAESAALVLTAGAAPPHGVVSPWHGGATLAVTIWYEATQGHLGAAVWLPALLCAVLAAGLALASGGLSRRAEA